MSNYGPPGGPNHDNPQEPPSGAPTPVPYDTPSDPWADAEGEGARPGDVWGQGSGPFPPGPAYPPVPQPPPAPDSTYPAPGATWSPAAPEGSSGRGGRTGFVVVLSILAALILGSGALAVNLIGDRDETGTVGDAGADPTGTVTGVPDDDSGGESGEQYVGADPSVPSADPSSDAQFVTVGQCVANEGDEEEPRLAITECQDGTYEVLRRFDAATTGKDDAKAKCAQVAGYTDWYFFDSPFDALDYVLCLKQR